MIGRKGMNQEPIIAKLKPGKEKHIARGHPWVFSGAIESWQGHPVCGSVVDVVSAGGTWMARGLAHPEASLTIRLCTWRPDMPIDAAFFAARIDAAIALRKELTERGIIPAGTDAYRLFYSESDGLSGLIVDRYADTLMIQVGAKALVPHLPGIVDHLCAATGIERVVVGTQDDSLAHEGLGIEPLAVLNRNPPDRVRIMENGHAFDVDVRGGQKTGFFLDQRMNRLRVAQYASGRRVLSAYCYTGAFEVYAAAAGATEILGLDRSDSALALARQNHELNHTTVPLDYIKADVPLALRRFRDSGRTFDMIILDPPRFVANQAQREKGLRAYKDINLLAMKLLSKGGILATFSCSGQISQDDFITIIDWAAIDCGRNVAILELLSQPTDHPVLAVFQESSYLKGAICRIE